MAKGDQVFLCYARDDWTRVEPIYTRLASEFRPWVDKKNLRPGDRWRSKIPAAIRDSQFFLVLLTSQSTNKRGYLQKEIKEALDIQDELPDAGRYVIPVRLERCSIPDRLTQIQSADLFDADGWHGLFEILREDDPEGTAPSALQVTGELQRPERLTVGGVQLPCFFPSISSAAKNSLEPLDHLRIIVSLGFPQFLISAYDLGSATQGVSRQLHRLLLQAAAKGQVVLLDSGLYEKKWLNTKGWTKAKFRKVLEKAPCHIAFCYDDPDPPNGAEKISTQILSGVSADKAKSGFEIVVPIVHSKSSSALPDICTKIARAIDTPLVAVPERELGDGIFECAVSIRKIREALNRLGKYVPIHILGTGNPLSILAYVWAGADSFDGLDWCQTAVDHKSGRLYHSLQLDFFQDQTEFAGDREMSYMTRLLAHNLEFYRNWMSRIQSQMTDAGLAEMMDEFMPSEFASRFRSLE